MRIGLQQRNWPIAWPKDSSISSTPRLKGYETDAITASLRRRGISRVCHITPCHRLPDVLWNGGLLSFKERQARGIAEDEQPHYWGPPGRKEALGDYVLCSFMPSWGLVQGHTDELAIIILDADSVCCRPSVLFCPTNTARSRYSDADILAMSGIDAFDASFPNPNTYQAGDSEILVPNGVPLVDFRGMVFWDQDSLDYWRQKLRSAFAPTNPKPTIPAARIIGSADGVGGLWGFRFPGNWRPMKRQRP